MNNPLYLSANDNTLLNKWEPVVKKFADMKTTSVKQTHFAYKSIHAGQEPEKIHGSVNVPIHLTSTFAQPYPGKLSSQYDYSRCGNPTITAFAECLTSLDYGKYGEVFSAGCGGTTTIFSLAKSNEHIICIDDVYGGTNRLINKVLKPQYNINCDMVDLTNLETFKKAIKPNTK